MKKTLLWHQGALGDLILSLPAVYAVKKHNGGCLHLICRGEMSDLIIENNLAEEVTSNEEGIFGFLFGAPAGHPSELKAFLGSFDEAFVFMRNRNDLFFDNMRRYVRHYNYIHTFPPPGLRTHVSFYQLQQLADLGINNGGVFPVLTGGGDPASPDGRPLIVIHPGSGGKKKCWPLQSYLRLMEELQRKGDLSFVVTLGPAEDYGEYQSVSDFVSERGICAEIMRDMSVFEVARVLKKASLYVGNDSGATHLAAALGAPSVAIFGPTDHEVWKPLGDNVRIVRCGYPCSPCPEEAYRLCRDVACLKSLPVETVLEEVRKAERGPDYNPRLRTSRSGLGNDVSECSQGNMKITLP